MRERPDFAGFLPLSSVFKDKRSVKFKYNKYVVFVNFNYICFVILSFLNNLTFLIMQRRLSSCSYGKRRTVMRQNIKTTVYESELQHARESLPDDRINV